MMRHGRTTRRISAAGSGNDGMILTSGNQSEMSARAVSLFSRRAGRKVYMPCTQLIWCIQITLGVLGASFAKNDVAILACFYRRLSLECSPSPLPQSGLCPELCGAHSVPSMLFSIVWCLLQDLSIKASF